MTTLTVKLLLMPPLIGLVTLAARRWGVAVGGWIGGLPWVAGPISVFLALEQGPAFAARAAVPALAASLGIVGFCRVYVALAPRFGWAVCALAGYAVYLSGAWLASLVPLNLYAVYGAALVTIAVTLRSFPNPPLPATGRPPAFDIPLRMAVATGFVVAVTKAAEWLGPAWSGLLTPFPIMTTILAAFTHQQQGWQASTRILRGLLSGMFGFVTFLFAVGWLLLWVSIPATYGLALLAALGVSSLAWRRR